MFIYHKLSFSIGNFDFVIGSKLSSTYAKISRIGYIDNPEPLEDDFEDERAEIDAGKY